jgi:hypothetical protein
MEDISSQIDELVATKDRALNAVNVRETFSQMWPDDAKDVERLAQLVEKYGCPLPDNEVARDAAVLAEARSSTWMIALADFTAAEVFEMLVYQCLFNLGVEYGRLHPAA